MEQDLFYCYQEWVKNRDGSIKKQLSEVPKFGIFLLSLLLLLLGVFIWVSLQPVKETGEPNIAALFVGVGYVLICILVSLYTEWHNIKNSKQDMKKHKQYYTDMEKSIFKNFKHVHELILQLIEKYNASINSIEERIKLKHKALNRIFEVMIIPLSAAILGALPNLNSSTQEALEFSIVLILVIVLIYEIGFFCLFVYEMIMRYNQDKYKRFVFDLKSILDYKKYVKEQDESNENAAPSETSQEVSNAIT